MSFVFIAKAADIIDVDGESSSDSAPESSMSSGSPGSELGMYYTRQTQHTNVEI